MGEGGELWGEHLGGGGIRGLWGGVVRGQKGVGGGVWELWGEHLGAGGLGGGGYGGYGVEDGGRGAMG